MKRVYPVVLSCLLIAFSFYYTNKVAGIVRGKDPIMQSIKEEKANYEKKAINANVSGDNIIPGKNGKKVNIEASFQKMSQYGKYNDSLYVFDEVEPEVSINTYFDKYVESGREDSKDVALVFDILRFDNMDDVLSLLESNNVTATFFVDGLFMENNRSLLENVSKKGYEIELLSYNGGYDKIYFESSLHVLNDITKDRPKYCVAHYDKKEVLDICNSLSLHTVIPSVDTSNNSFGVVKNKLRGGSIIGLSNSRVNLNTIINYIKQKGYNLVRLDTLLQEQLEK
ncbi:sporulation protein, polysaccharide deacetylase family [human gut metagenome]|uniref:Sporulation protein, polysaccharide deacetylase family n=1 Tax=human gut metagenome TaxID=408170 RepID=K1R655_9ZZZZ